ncbi:hypothetical protein CYG48_12700 [Neorhizobium sp. SOG26]|uniref:hypothetical protein n=1 Tax=Neorhizobium sp. SOG26 TaxID=2060726 RepID=UPI000E5716D4|nr:hypothetical protein [Neorhizobium sp. SOG26]AXV16470.1 hypothetical protein CYG48_12700 [Neorhizobium sp. SOG26]
MDIATAKALLPEIRLNLETIGPEWAESYDVKSGSSQVCDVNVKTGEVYPLVTIHKSCPSDAREIIRKVPTYLRALLLLREEAVREYRKLASAPAKSEKAPDYAAECGMRCNDPMFRRFLTEQHGLETSDLERVATRVRSMLAVSSRAELNSDPEAAARWISLRAEFEAWKRMP